MRTALLCLIVATSAASAPVVGQSPASAPGPGTLVSVAGGVGLGTPDIGGHLSLSASRGAGDLIVRLAGGSDFELFDFSESTRDIAVLFGRRRRSDGGWIRAAAGIGHVRRVARGEVEECAFFCSYEEVVTTNMGLALQLDLVRAPRRGLGLGFSGLGNVNSLRSFASVTVTLHLGRVR